MQAIPKTEMDQIASWDEEYDQEYLTRCYPGGPVVKNPLVNARDVRDVGLIPRSRKSPGEGNSNLLQYSCLRNPMDRGAWKATVHKVAKS